MASISALGRYITATLGVEPALWHDPTQAALRRYRRRAWATLAIGLAAGLVSLVNLYVFELVEGRSPGDAADAVLSMILIVEVGLWTVAAMGLIGGVVSLFRAERMARWLARSVWRDVEVRVGHSGGTGVVLIPDDKSFSGVPTEPYALQTWRWRLKPLQGVERLWVARPAPADNAVILHVPGRPELYVARRSALGLLRRWHVRSFATGLPPAGGA